jgi:hypothetical protein
MAKAKVEVQESTVYDNFIGKKNEEEKVKSIFTFMDIEEPDPEKNLEEWKKHWNGMPEFKQEDQLPAKKLIINFRTEEDFKTFSELYMKHVDTNLEISEKTKSFWYPKREKENISVLRWIEEDIND